MDKSPLRKWKFNEESASRMAGKAWQGSQSYIHPRLARQIVSDYNITSGRCLDIGCGAARLTVEMARITDLEMIGLDSSRPMLTVAHQKVRENDLNRQVKLVEAAVENMPFPNNHFDLIVSRGAIGFFSDKVQAFREIYRVLRPKGRTYIGGGDGRGWPSHPRDIIKKILFKINVKRRFLNPNWRRLWLSREQWEGILHKAGVNDYIIQEGRLWIDIHKK